MARRIVHLSTLVLRSGQMTQREVEQARDWLLDDWEAKDIDRDACRLIHRLLLTVEKGLRDPSNRRK